MSEGKAKKPRAKRICNADGYHETPEAADLVARYNAMPAAPMVRS